MYLFGLQRLGRKCTNIYNAQYYRTTHWIFVLRRLRCRCGLYKIPAVVVYEKPRCRLISFCLLLYLRFKPWSYWKIPNEQNCAVFRFPHLKESVPRAHGCFPKFTPKVEWKVRSQTCHGRFCLKHCLNPQCHKWRRVHSVVSLYLYEAWFPLKCIPVRKWKCGSIVSKKATDVKGVELNCSSQIWSKFASNNTMPRNWLGII